MMLLLLFLKREMKKIDPTTFASQFNHIFVIVQKMDYHDFTDKTYYRVEMVVKPTVPTFPPFLPKPPIFQSDSKFRNYLISKLVNGQQACLTSAQSFSNRLNKVRYSLLKDIISKNIKTEKKIKIGKGRFSTLQKSRDKDNKVSIGKLKTSTLKVKRKNTMEDTSITTLEAVMKENGQIKEKVINPEPKKESIILPEPAVTNPESEDETLITPEPKNDKGLNYELIINPESEDETVTNPEPKNENGKLNYELIINPEPKNESGELNYELIINPEPENVQS